uniref:OTU domain-containing protein n=1 Tax=viral metagenome TaxID=1070528 RepID=A0A6C0B4J7_9ZZZZ
MEDSNLLQFDKFLKNSILHEVNPKDKFLELVKTYYKLKHKNEQFLSNPKKKERTIPDFEAMTRGDYDEDTNSGKSIKTNLPLKFEENNTTLKLCIRDNQNIKDIIEININLNTVSPKKPEFENITKEHLLYKIGSVKNKKNMIESLVAAGKDNELLELREYWVLLKKEVEKFTEGYSEFIEIKHAKDKNLDAFHANVIASINRNELIDFEKNLLLSSLVKTHSSNTANIIQYYIVINIIINKYNKALSILINKPVKHNLIGSVVYHKSKIIDKDNVFIVKEQISDSLINVLDIEGNINKVNIDSYDKIYGKLKTRIDDPVNIARKTLIDKSAITVTKTILDKTFKLKHTGDIKYIEVKRKTLKSHNDVVDEHPVQDVESSQEIIKSPEYKLISSLSSLDTFIPSDLEGAIYIYPNIFHRVIGDGYINSIKQGTFIKEDCEDCDDNLNKIDDWRNKLTKSYVNICSKNGEIIPIVLDKKLFSSVAHYYVYYSNKDNKKLADQYLFNNKRGQTSITPSDFELELDNGEWDKTENILNIPNHIYELLRITAAKFIQDDEMKRILIRTGDVQIINACFENFLTGEYEISKELIMVRKYIRDDIISNFYINFLEDQELSKITRQTIIHKQIPQFMSIKTDKIIKKIKGKKESSKEPDVRIPTGVSKIFERGVNRKLQLKKLESYTTDVLGKYLYNVPGDGNCLFYAVACAAFYNNTFDNLRGELKSVLEGTLVAELCHVTVNDRLKQIPILKKTALVLKSIVSEIIQYNYDAFLLFFKKHKIPKGLDDAAKLEKMDMIIQQQAVGQQANVLNFIHSLLVDIEHTDNYNDINDYITAIAADANELREYTKGWGGDVELQILSALLCLNINTYPSNSVDISDLDNYYNVKYKKTIKICLLPTKYSKCCSSVTEIDLGYLEQPPQHYFAIVDSDDLEVTFQSILEDVDSDEEQSNLQKLLHMGYEFELANNALRLNQNNLDMALNYIFQILQSNVDLLESDDMYNYKFQTNELAVPINNKSTDYTQSCYIAQFHEGSENSYYQNYSFLEGTHDYIQWLFPMKHLSRNNPDPRTVLKISELEFMKDSELVKTNLFKSLRTMMDFFGGTLEMKYDYTYPEPMYYDLQLHENAHERLVNLNNHSHNYLRITRILNYLNSMEHYELQYLIINFFIDHIFVNNHNIVWNDAIIASLSEHWLDEVTNPDEKLRFQQAVTVYKKQLERRRKEGIQFGGQNVKQFKPLENKYLMFPFKYKTKLYNIVYVIYADDTLDKRVEIIGIMHSSNKIMSKKNIKKNTVLDKLLIKVHKKLFDGKLKIPKKKIIKLEYKHDLGNNNIELNGKVVGKMTDKKKIIFN